MEPYGYQWTESEPMKLFAMTCILLAISIAVLMLYTTPRASIKASFHDRQAMWGMLRRLFFLSIAGGNFGTGIWVAASWAVLPWPILLFWLMMATPIAILLALRAGRLIDQDYWIGGTPYNIGRPPKNVHEATDEIREVVKDIQNPARRARAMRAVNDLDHVSATN